MRCPYCQNSETKVLDSRLLKEGTSVRRRRKCEDCEKRFTTYETIELSMPNIVKRDGRREAYNRSKIHEGFTKACQKRPIPTERIDKLLESIEKDIREISEKEVTSMNIGNLVMSYLRTLDPVAYIRFASVYRTFKDVDEFVKDIKHDEQNYSAGVE